MLGIWRRAWCALLLGLLWLAEVHTFQQTPHDVGRGMASSLRAVHSERTGNQRQQKAVAGKAAMETAHKEKTEALLHHSVKHTSGAAASRAQRRRERRDAGAVAPVVVSAANSRPAESSTPATQRARSTPATATAVAAAPGNQYRNVVRTGPSESGVGAVLALRATLRARKTKAAAGEPMTAATAAAPGDQYRGVVRSVPPEAADVKKRIARAAAKRKSRSEARIAAAARNGASTQRWGERTVKIGRAPYALATTQGLLHRRVNGHDSGVSRTARIHRRYEDTAHAQQHFLSVLRDIKEKLDEFHGVPADDPAFGRRWSSCAVVRAAALLTLLTPHHENAACRAPFCGTLFR
jgi:hypothetical protein